MDTFYLYFMKFVVPEKIEKARSEKDRGNSLFQQGQFKDALAAYHYAKLYVKGLMNLKPEESEAIKAIELSCNLNMAAVYIKFEWWQKAITVASQVLETDASNVKAMFRRGKAHLELNNTEKARVDIVQAIKLSPNDKGLREEYTRLQAKEAAQAQAAKQVFKNVFESDLSEE
jgi:tetratricopeptide (TPR) repeat protein